MMSRLIPIRLGRPPGSAAIQYLLLDRFSTDAAAPLTSPRTCEPGPGTLTIVDTGNKLSISGGKITLTGFTGSPAAYFISPSTFARAAGLTLLSKINNTSAHDGDLQWATAFNIAQMGIRLNQSGNIDWVENGSYSFPANWGAYSTGTEYEFAPVCRSAGAFILIKGGVYSNWTLLWVLISNTSANLLAGYRATSSGAGTLDDFRVTTLPAPWNTDYGIATDRKATSAALDTITTTADSWVEHTITAATGVTQELTVRYTDDNNCWVTRMSQSGSTIKLMEEAAGVETQRASASQTWTNGVTYRVVVISDGTTIKNHVANLAKNSYASAATNQTAILAKASHAGTEFNSYPRYPSFPTV